MKHKTTLLTLDQSLIYHENLQGRGLFPEKIGEHNAEFFQSYQTHQLQVQQQECDYIELTHNKRTIDQCRKIWEPYKPWTKKVVLIGIGGASQTPKALHNAFNYKNTQVEFLFGGDYTDPHEINRLEQEIRGSEQSTTIIIMSKSGTTAEPASLYLHFKKLFQTLFKDYWKKHFLFVTSSTDGLFIKEVKHEGLNFIPTSLVGDRFATFSVLGILPAVILNLDAEKLLKGGSDFFEQISQQRQEHNMAWNIASVQYLYQSLYGIQTFVSFAYHAGLFEFNYWLKQLWGESLGKEGKGILLYPAMGPKDQHSVLQMFNEGPWFSTFLFLSQSKYSNEILLEHHGITELNHFHDKSFGYITQSSCYNTQLTLKNYNRPSMHLQFEKLNEETFGALWALFEMVVVYLGMMFDLENVFDQPGVTQSRKYIDASLKRIGSDADQAILKQTQDSIKKHILNYP